MNKFITYSVLLAVLLFAASGTPAAEDPPRGLEGWQRLHLEGRKFLVARAHVDLERWPGEERMRCRSLLRALGARREHVAHAWEPRAERSLLWVEHSVGRKLRVGRRVAGEQGDELEVRRYKPAEDGEWGDRETKTLALAEGDESLLDAWYALVELPRLATPGTHRVLAKDGPITLEVKRSAPYSKTLRLEDLEEGGRREIELELVELALTRADASGETLLGLSGPTVLVMDVASGALVEARGEKEGVPGTIRMRLTGFARTPTTWRDPALPSDARQRLDQLDAERPSP